MTGLPESGPPSTPSAPDPVEGAPPPPSEAPRAALTPPTPVVAAGAPAGVAARLVDLPLAGAVYAGLLFVAFTLTDPTVVARGDSEAAVFFWLQAMDDGILALVALGFGRLRFPGSWRAMGFRDAGLRWCGIGAVGGAGAALAAWVISLALDHWGWPAPVHPVESVLGAAQELRDFLVVLLAVSVLVPIAEETFFRGFAYHLVRARFGVSAAIVATSLGFALVHGLEAGAWIPVLPVGVVLAVLVERSRSLWPAVIGHAVVNALAVLVA